MSFRQRSISRVIVGTLVLALLLAWGIRGEALTGEGPLQVEGDRLTGHVSQVTLRAILEQLQKELGITYEAPEGELEKVISVDLREVPIIPALATILAPWDYAFTANSKGKLQFLYITPKAPPGEIPQDMKEPSEIPPPIANTDTPSYDPGDARQEPGDVDVALPQEQDSTFDSPSGSAFGSPTDQMQGFNSPSAGVPMAIQPVPPGTTMPMMPPSGGSGMNVTPAANQPDMPIIPGTSYPPMEIQPVPDYLKEEMLRNIQP